MVLFMNSTKARAAALAIPAVEKCPTGIAGLDEITLGGLPKGRPTLLCGSAGCGKTLLAMTFLYNGAVNYDEPGVFIAFEERTEELIKNVGSLNYDLQKLIDQKNSRSIMSMLTQVRSPKPVTTIWRVFSYGSASRLTPSAPSASSLIQSTSFLAA